MGRFIKRLFDLLSSILGLILLSPLFLVVSLLIFIDDPGTVIFKQQRVGEKNKIFTIYKFRSMKLNTPDVATHLLTDSKSYITRVGRIIRKTSIDELPQLLNILKGDMSVVGPRPALYNQEELLEMRQREGIHNAKPGLTGWAQVNGRDDMSIEKKIHYDKIYMDRKSFFFDMYIILRTIIVVFTGRGNKDNDKN